MQPIVVMLLVCFALGVTAVDPSSHTDAPAGPKQKPLNLASINQTQMERIVAVWPVKSRFSKKDEVWRWYGGDGNVVALL